VFECRIEDVFAPYEGVDTAAVYAVYLVRGHGLSDPRTRHAGPRVVF
jgi:hypothetical protein